MIFWYQSCPDFTGPKRQGKSHTESPLIAPVEAAPEQAVTAPEPKVPIPPQTTTTTTTESKRFRMQKRELIIL